MKSPKLSVIIASHNPGPALDDCLAALDLQCGGDDRQVEIILADGSSDDTAERVRDRYPAVRVLKSEGPANVPDLRGMGMAIATGDIVAIVDPYCVVQKGWIDRVRELHTERPESVIGGSVEHGNSGGRGLVGWATFLSEYLAFVSPFPAGPAEELTGNNLAYKRDALGDLKSYEHTGFWKTFFNKGLRDVGHTLWTDPSLAVSVNKSIGLFEFLKSRYYHGRCFGAMRVSEAGTSTRLFRALTTPAIPALGVARQVRGFWPRGRDRARFIAALPLLTLFHAGWAWGELWGYLRGAGNSCAKLHY